MRAEAMVRETIRVFERARASATARRAGARRATRARRSESDLARETTNGGMTTTSSSSSWSSQSSESKTNAGEGEGDDARARAGEGERFGTREAGRRSAAKREGDDARSRVIGRMTMKEEINRGFSSRVDAKEGGEERVAKILARRGTCSRREAEQLIANGAVIVNGVRIREQGFKCSPMTSEIVIDESGARWLSSKLTVALNKPPGVVSNLPTAGEVAAWTWVEPKNAWMRAMEKVPIDDLRRVTNDAKSLNVVGRLDKDSRGLLILTQDGALARSVIGGNEVMKTYIVTLDSDVRESHMRSLNGSILLEGTELLPMQVRRLGNMSRTLEFRLREGKNRQIRRVCEKFGLRVVDLERIQVGEVELGDLPEGAWRVLTPSETKSLRELEFE